MLSAVIPAVLLGLSPPLRAQRRFLPMRVTLREGPAEATRSQHQGGENHYQDRG